MGTNRLLHEMELSFFGTISASVSHELNNVLSIINEYAGLLDDLVTADKKGIPFENEKIKKENIQSRTAYGGIEAGK